MERAISLAQPRRASRWTTPAVTVALVCLAAGAAWRFVALALGWIAPWGAAAALPANADPQPLVRSAVVTWLWLAALFFWCTAMHPGWSRRLLSDVVLAVAGLGLAASAVVPLTYGDGRVVLVRLASLAWRLLLNQWINPALLGVLALAAFAAIDWYRNDLRRLMTVARVVVQATPRLRALVVALTVAVLVAVHVGDLLSPVGPGALWGRVPQPYDLLQLVPRPDAASLPGPAIVPVPSARLPFLAYWLFAVSAAASNGRAVTGLGLLGSVARLLPAGAEGWLVRVVAIGSSAALSWRLSRQPARVWGSWHRWILAWLAIVALDLRWSELLRSLDRPLTPDAQVFLAAATWTMDLPRFDDKWFISSHIGMLYQGLNSSVGGALFIVVTWLVDGAIGLSRVPIVLVSVFSSVVLVIVTAALGRQWTGRTAGVLAASFLALSPALARQSAYGLREEFTATAATSAVILLFCCPARGRTAVAAVFCLSIAMLTRLETMLPLAVAFVLAAVVRRWPIRRTLGAALVVAVLVGPLLVGYALTTGDPLRPINFTARVDAQNELEAPTQGPALRTSGPAIGENAGPGLAAWYVGRRGAVQLAGVALLGAAGIVWDTIATPEQLWPFRLFGAAPAVATVLGCVALLAGAALSARRAWPLLVYGCAAAAPYVVRHGLGLWEERLAYLLHPVAAVLVAHALVCTVQVLEGPVGRLRSAPEWRALLGESLVARRAAGLTEWRQAARRHPAEIR